MAESAGRALALVDVGAVERNCRALKERTGEQTELCAVVKANGYGHGAAACAAGALRGGATRLAVASADEAAELRLYFPEVPLFVMGALTEEELGTTFVRWRSPRVAGPSRSSRRRLSRPWTRCPWCSLHAG